MPYDKRKDPVFNRVKFSLTSLSLKGGDAIENHFYRSH